MPVPRIRARWPQLKKLPQTNAGGATKLEQAFTQGRSRMLPVLTTFPLDRRSESKLPFAERKRTCTSIRRGQCDCC